MLEEVETDENGFLEKVKMKKMKKSEKEIDPARGGARGINFRPRPLTPTRRGRASGAPLSLGAKRPPPLSPRGEAEGGDGPPRSGGTATNEARRSSRGLSLAPLGKRVTRAR